MSSSPKTLALSIAVVNIFYPFWIWLGIQIFVASGVLFSFETLAGALIPGIVREILKENKYQLFFPRDHHLPA